MSKTVKEKKKIQVEDEDINIHELSEKIESLEKEKSEQKDKFLRLAAEYDNYRKRTEKDKFQIYDNAVSNTVVEILPIADSIDMALKSSEKADENYKKGLLMIKDQLNASLSKLNVEAFAEKGDDFNPNIHNAISHIDDENLDENVIFEVFQKGYKLGDKVIRHAMVIVAN